MNIKGSNDDCYFYFYSSCTKGSECPFRHCEAALGTEIVCSLWREGRCYRSNCKFRHMESRINRASIACYWENQPGGCRKPHCVFLHKRARLNIHNSTENQALILPVSTTVTASTIVSKGIDSIEQGKSSVISPSVESFSNNSDDARLTPTFPVEPLVVSFDEESDSESASSTPMKSESGTPVKSKYNSNSVKQNLAERLSEKTDFGIKTLEQIRMEKIHKESEHFYKSDDTSGTVIPKTNLEVIRNATVASDKMFSFSAYEAPITSCSQFNLQPNAILPPIDITFKPASTSNKQECYPPVSDFISISDEPEDISTDVDVGQLSPQKDSNIRNRIYKRTGNAPYPDRSVLAKKAVNWKKDKEDSLDFKIKTLDEIRRERESKLSNVDKNLSNGDKVNDVLPLTTDSSISRKPAVLNNKNETSNVNGKSVGKLRLQRLSVESLLNHNISSEGHHSDKAMIKENRTQVLHEVQNISENQNKGDVKGKRKEIADNTDGRSPKRMKTDSPPLNPDSNSLPYISNDDKNISLNEEKHVKKLRRPVIKRNLISPPLMSVNSACVPVTVDEKNEVSSSESSDSGLPSNDKTVSKDEDCLVSSTVCEKNLENKTSRSSSVDEFDSLFLNESEMTLDGVEDVAGNGTEDILLEIQQLLDS